jgi:hypothetical protein
MYALARRILAAGRSVVLDAVFQRPEERAPAAALAAEFGVAFQGAWLEGRPDELRRRLATRTGDASDAGVAALDDQLVRETGPMDWRTHDAADLDRAAARMVPPEN